MISSQIIRRLKTALMLVLTGGFVAATFGAAWLNRRVGALSAELKEFQVRAEQDAAEREQVEERAKDIGARLETADQELNGVKSRLNVASNRLAKSDAEVAALHNDLAEWTALSGTPVESVKGALIQLKKTIIERDALLATEKVLLVENDQMKGKLGAILDPEKEVTLPDGLKGKILVSDPKYEFALLDIGRRQGAREGGRMLVNRNGKLVAKIRIKSVTDDRSIANVLVGWKFDEVREGDQVVY